MLDAAGLEEAVSAWLADASGSRTGGYLTASSQHAQPGSVARSQVGCVAELAEREEEVPVLARAADHSQLVRIMASITGAHSLQVPQQRMPSLFGAPPSRSPVQGTPLVGMSLPSPPRRLSEPALGLPQPLPPVVRPNCAHPELTPPQVPTDPKTTSDMEALLMQAVLMQTRALSRLLARGQGGDGNPWLLSAQTRLNYRALLVCAAPLRGTGSFIAGVLPHSRVRARPALAGRGASRPDCLLRTIRRFRRAARARPFTAGNYVGISRRLVRQDGSGDGYSLWPSS